MAFSRRVASVVAQREGMMAMPPRSHFIRHFVRNATIATSVIGGGLFIGMGGYHWFARSAGWKRSTTPP